MRGMHLENQAARDCGTTKVKQERAQGKKDVISCEKPRGAANRHRSVDL